jgi:hypothetical protein
MAQRACQTLQADYSANLKALTMYGQIELFDPADFELNAAPVDYSTDVVFAYRYEEGNRVKENISLVSGDDAESLPALLAAFKDFLIDAGFTYVDDVAVLTERGKIYAATNY